jgi:hypothetical protein
MKKSPLILIVVLGCTLALALAHDPRTTAKNFSHQLQIEGAGNLALNYKAMHFNNDTYQRMKGNDQFRERMNQGLWSDIGTADAAFDVVAGDQTISKGKYTLGLSIEANDSFAVVLKSSSKTVKIPLKTTTENADVPFLTFSLFPTEKPDTFVLEGRCGKFRGTADVKVPYLAEHSHTAPHK